MPFHPISIREAMSKIKQEDWVLPMTQRPYVWGGRSNYQDKVCLLFDSLYRKYPIGNFLIWDTREAIPCRSFVTNFDPD